MPNHRTYRCPDCGTVGDFWVPDGEWNTFAPECPACASALEQEFVPFAVRGDRYRASKIAEAGAIAQSEGPRIALDLKPEDRRTGEQLIAHIREDITEHRAPAPSPDQSGVQPMAPASRQMIEGALPFGRAYRRQTGSSPIERYQQSVERGQAFDANRLLGRRGM